MPAPLSGPTCRLKTRGRVAVRRFALIASLITLFLPQQAIAYQQDVEQLSVRMADAIAKSGRKTIAVVDFTDLQGNVTELGRFLAEEFSVALSNDAKDFEVIDRTNLKILLQEHKLASTGIIDLQTARKLGEIAGVQALITGNITPFGDSVRLSIKILDVSTARVINGFFGDVPRTKAIDELLAKGIGSDGSRYTPVEGSGSATPPSQLNRKAVQRAGDFSVELQSCSLSGSRISCRLLITNNPGGRGDGFRQPAAPGGTSGLFRLVREYGQLSSRLFDSAGNEFHANVVRLGNQQTQWNSVDNTLVEGVPMNAYLVFENLPPETNQIKALVVQCWDGRQDYSLKFAEIGLSK